MLTSLLRGGVLLGWGLTTVHNQRAQKEDWNCRETSGCVIGKRAPSRVDSYAECAQWNDAKHRADFLHSRYLSILSSLSIYSLLRRSIITRPGKFWSGPCLLGNIILEQIADSVLLGVRYINPSPGSIPFRGRPIAWNYCFNWMVWLLSCGHPTFVLGKIFHWRCWHVLGQAHGSLAHCASSSGSHKVYPSHKGHRLDTRGTGPALWDDQAHRAWTCALKV